MVLGEKSKRSEPAAVRWAEDRAQLHLRVQYTVAQILSDAPTEHEACTRILSTLCENLDWQWGAFWLRRDDELRMLTCWRSAQFDAAEFDQISRACVFRRGEGLPGKVWAESAAVWIPDFVVDPAMLRRHIASRCGLHAVIGIPISGQEFLGIIELFNTRAIDPQSDLLKTLTAAGAQIGQFLERKRAEQALADSQGLLKGVFQGARDPILLANNDGHCIEANSAAAKLFATSREKLLTMRIWDFVPMGPVEEAQKHWSQILKTPGYESDFTLRRNDGFLADLEYRATIRVIPGVHLVVLRDMTSRKQRERSARVLAAAGAILGEGLNLDATINRVARVAIPEFADWCVLDLLNDDGKIERAAIAHADPELENQARELSRRVPVDPTRPFGAPNVIRTGVAEFVDITPEILRKVLGEEHFQSADKWSLGAAVISPLKKQGRTFGALSFWRSKARGPFSAGDAELADELARRAGWALENARLYDAAKQELQRREKAEADLIQLNADLEARIKERTAALQESHSELESFCYSVSHDLRAPLRSMQGFSHALIEDHADRLNPEGQDFAKRILSAAEHMDGLLADVLAYSRLSRQELEPEAVNIDEVIEDARVHLFSQIKAKAADLQIATCGRKVVAHRAVLELMIVNLLDNALKFVAPDRTPKISVTCERRGQTVRLWVRDNGIGIAAEHQHKIFRIFERLHGVETYPGTGIGLALVQKAAERMNGSVGLESTPGQGSAFWIELPCAN
ncbi:MAG TPA: ATP-binding protein [Verrucomicrobiae bacterium]|nr:ATP-binding protein [Verrucomicrobiae bacterium]